MKYLRCAALFLQIVKIGYHLLGCNCARTVFLASFSHPPTQKPDLAWSMRRSAPGIFFIQPPSILFVELVKKKKEKTGLHIIIVVIISRYSGFLFEINSRKFTIIIKVW